MSKWPVQQTHIVLMTSLPFTFQKKRKQVSRTLWETKAPSSYSLLKSDDQVSNRLMICTKEIEDSRMAELSRYSVDITKALGPSVQSLVSNHP